jgi:hypothetical protein
MTVSLPVAIWRVRPRPEAVMIGDHPIDCMAVSETEPPVPLALHPVSARYSVGQIAVLSIGTPPIGAPLADTLAEIEMAVGRSGHWAEMARLAGGTAVPKRGHTPAGTRRRWGLDDRDTGEG